MTTTTTTTNSLLNPHQSGFTKRHSTETLFTSMSNKLVSANSRQQASCLCLLDISAAFDATDHNILLKSLPGLVLLTLLSLLALSMLRHRKHHPDHTLSPVVFRKVQFLGPSCASSTLLHSVQSSKHNQLTIIYTPMTLNYSCPFPPAASPNP